MSLLGRELIGTGAAIFSEILLCDGYDFLALYTTMTRKYFRFLLTIFTDHFLDFSRSVRSNAPRLLLPRLSRFH